MGDNDRGGWGGPERRRGGGGGAGHQHLEVRLSLSDDLKEVLGGFARELKLLTDSNAALKVSVDTLAAGGLTQGVVDGIAAKIKEGNDALQARIDASKVA